MAANKARGEYEHKIGKETLAFALTLEASEALENMREGERSVETITSILSMMTAGSAKERTQAQIKKLPITIAEFGQIIKGAKDATNDAMPDGRDVGNEPNRKTRRASASKAKKK